MQVSVEKTTGLGRKVTVSLPATQFESATNARLKSLAKTAKLDGFRPGKVPLSVLEKKYGQSVRNDILSDMVQRSYGQAITQEKLQPAGLPHIDAEIPASGEDLVYTATLEILPEITIGDLSKIKIESPVVELEDNDVDATLEKLRKQRATWNEVQRAAAKGDQVKIDFTGTIDGEPFDGGTGENVDLELGSGQMIEGFEDQLVGVQAGDSRDVKVKFPKDYSAESLRGKKAVFAVTCKAVAEQELPELNEDFVKSFGFEDGALDSLKQGITEQMELELKQNKQRYTQEQVMEGLLGIHKIELPNVMVDAEIESLQKQAVQRLGMKDIDLSKLPRDGFEERARKRVGLALIISKITQDESINPDDARVKQLINDAVAGYQNKDDMVQYYLSNQEIMQQFQSMDVEQQVIEFVMKSAKCTDKKMSFDELVGQKVN